MGILRADRIAGLGGANAITGSTHFAGTADTGNYLRIDTGATEDFTFGTGDFTIEFWANSQASGFQQHFWDGRGTTNSQRMLIYIDTNNTMYYFDGTAARIQSSSALPIGDWVHVALVRASATTKLYWNGTQTGSTHTSDTVDFLAPTHGSAFIGSNGGTDGIEPSGGGYFNGFLSNYRIVKGTAVYTANFTPPTTRLTAIDGTVLLTCTSSGNVSKTEGGNDVQPSAKNSNSTPPIASRFTPNSPVGFSTTTDVGSQYGITFEDNTRFDTLSYMVPPAGNTRERNRGRGLIAGGCTPLIAEIEYIQIQSQGNSTTFGNLSATRFGLAGCASATRGLFGGGAEPSIRNYIEFVTIASTGNAADFGDLTAARRDIGALSNQTRGMWTGGNPGSSPNATDTIDFVTIATAGNASDFGNLTASMQQVQSTSSPTRGIMGGGSTVPASINTIQYITIATTGNASDFGDLTRTAASLSTAASATRAVFANGGTNTIDYITIASTGNATDFGDTTAVRGQSGGISNSIRGVFTGGYQPSPTSSDANVIDFIEFATTGNAKDFGDIDRAANDSNREHGTCSDSHGGIS